MEYAVRSAEMNDLERIGEIYAQARKFMAETGNPNQWGKTRPPREQTERDIEERRLYAVTDGEQIHGVFYFWIGADPTYALIYDGAWHSDAAYGTIHRIAGDGSGGILKTAVEFGKKQIGYLRIDTHEDNKIMQRAVEKLGYKRCGIIHLENGEPRIAYDQRCD